MASQDGLQEAIQLLSCKPGSKISQSLATVCDDNVYDFYTAEENFARDCCLRENIYYNARPNLDLFEI